METGAAVGAGTTLRDFLGESGPGEAAGASTAAGQQSVPETSGGWDTRGSWRWDDQGWSAWYSPWHYRSWGASWYGEPSAASAGSTGAADANRGTSEARAAETSGGATEPDSAGPGATASGNGEETTFDPWERAARDRGEEWRGPWSNQDYSGWRWSWREPWSWRDGDWNESRPWQDAPLPKPDYSDPPSWPGWSHRRQWSLALKRWNKSTDLPVHRRAEKVLRTFGWEMQSDFEHISEDTLASHDYLEVILKVIDSKAGVREDDEKRRAFRAVMSENVKKKDETLAQYAVRRQREFSRASDFGVTLPAELRAAMLREGALLTEQNMQNLTTLVGGNDYDPEAVCRALGRMDVRSDRLIGYVAEENQSYLEMNHDGPSESEEEDEEVILADLDNMSLFEDQVHEVFAVLEARKRTWKENKIYKANLRKDRGSFTKTEAGSTAPRVAQGGPPGMAHRKDKKMKLNRDQLKKVTRCRRCHKKGHWAEDCTMPPPSNPSSGPKMSGFVYSGSSGSGPTSAFTYATGMNQCVWRWCNLLPRFSL